MEQQYPKNWDEWLKPIVAKDYMVKLKTKLQEERRTFKVVPEATEVMAAFKETPVDKVRMVIIGQDPYPSSLHAHGLAFSSKSESTPETLKNIFNEIRNSLYPFQRTDELFKTNNLTSWARQGILLLNASLTCRENSPGSHYGFGWEQFITDVIGQLNSYPDQLVFILMGSRAQEHKTEISIRHPVLLCSHPSPKSANEGFLGTDIFKRAKDELRKIYLKEFVHKLELHLDMKTWRNTFYELLPLFEDAGIKLNSDTTTYNMIIHTFVTSFPEFVCSLNPEIENLYFFNLKT